MRLFSASLLSSLVLATSFSAYSAASLDLNSLPEQNIPSYIKAFKQQRESLWIRYAGQQYPITMVGLTGKNIIAQFEKGLVFISFDMEEQSPGEKLIIAEGQFELTKLSERVLAKADVIWQSDDFDAKEQGDDYRYTGQVTNQQGEKAAFALSYNESLITGGTSRFTLHANQAVLTGMLGTNTYVQLSNIIEQHPEVDTVVIKQVRGSLNDEINMHTGNLLRNAGLNTQIPQDGFAYSGGVDLFTAGVKRQVEANGTLGVHSWCCYQGKTADKLDKTSPAHHDQLNYFSKMLGEDLGPEFYFYTLHASPFTDVHPMTRQEMQKYSLLNE